MRATLSLMKNWWVSASARDAARAASGTPWTPQDLELADDPENHPQRVALPGGTQYGKRPLETPQARTEAIKADEGFVGANATAAQAPRLPSSFLSYAQRVAIPANWQGQTVRLLLDNVRYHVTVSINGRQVEQYVGGLEPHTLDVTRFVTPGQDALLLITVGDSGVSGHRRFDPYRYTGTRLPTCKEIENNLVHPVVYGGADRAVGRVALEAVPPVRVEFVFADPKVAAGELHYTVALRNDTAKPAKVRMVSGAAPQGVQGSRFKVPGSGVKALLDEVVTVRAHGTQLVRRVIPWPDAILWDLDTPHLYTLRTSLAPCPSSPATRHSPPATRPATLDTHSETFGFREFTINGHSFYLNGKKIHLHGQSGHTSPESDEETTLAQKIAFLRAWKEKGNVVHFRLHARPQHKDWVVAADRVGMLVTTETALWTTGFHSFDWAGSEEACTRNVQNHFLEALVRRDRNNPSVVIWSLSNEMSPITPFDLENPKMAALTRAFRRIIAAAEKEDPSRVIQMSSAMDFLGHLRMYNLHYPKNWQAFPDYPHTAYWLDQSFLFPWYGPRRTELPSWGWRKDKPLYFGEFTCVFGATPDNQASIVGDVAFERDDFGTALVNEKLWPLEIKAYRRLDVSGFCAWATMFHGSRHYDLREYLRTPMVAAHTHALRPVAVLDHTYRTHYFARDEAPMELSIHNDTRHALELELVCEVLRGGKAIWTERMPPAVYGPAESRAFTSRFRAPDVKARTPLVYRATLRSGRRVLDRWERRLVVWPAEAGATLPAGLAILDPDGRVAERLRERGIAGARFARSVEELRGLADVAAVWIPFDLARVHLAEWQGLRRWVEGFVREGGLAVLDHAPDAVLAGLPVEIRNGKGYAEGGRLELTYAYNAAPHHPAVAGFTDADFSLWGADYYIAHRTYEIPQEGNARPLLVAGTDRGGLTTSPLMELPYGRGSFLLSSLEILEKLREAPVTVRLLQQFAAAQPQPPSASVGLCVGADTLRVLREVGLEPAGMEQPSPTDALRASTALVDGERLGAGDVAAVREALQAGRTVYLHALSAEQTRAVLAAFGLAGTVRDGKAQPREYDVFRHTHALADGMTNNHLYWIVNKAKVAPWTLAPLHPEPATARVEPGPGAGAWSLTRRGALTVWQVGAGTLVLDHLRWQLPDFDEPERPRRYVARLLTNLGVPLTRGVEKRMSQEFETAEERRERGHF